MKGLNKYLIITLKILLHISFFLKSIAWLPNCVYRFEYAI